MRFLFNVMVWVCLAGVIGACVNTAGYAPDPATRDGTQLRLSLNPPAENMKLNPHLQDAGFTLDKGKLSFESGMLRIVIEVGAGSEIRERFQIHDKNSGWLDLALVPGDTVGGEQLVYEDGLGQKTARGLSYSEAVLNATEDDGPMLRLEGGDRGFIWSKKISIDSSRNLFRTEVSIQAKEECRFQSLVSNCHFAQASIQSPPDLVWTPCLRPERNDLI
ncbi:MAG: hypothetical protein KJ645_12340, partial [Planctomycetes bacterium]|nr:hypothetical protein [Planctomycetota bacterium]